MSAAAAMKRQGSGRIVVTKGTRIGAGATLDPDPQTEQRWADTVSLGGMAEPEELKGLVPSCSPRRPGAS